eukprot:3182824-Prymnesium_polylepis.1
MPVSTNGEAASARPASAPSANVALPQPLSCTNSCVPTPKRSCRKARRYPSRAFGTFGRCSLQPSADAASSDPRLRPSGAAGPEAAAPSCRSPSGSCFARNSMIAERTSTFGTRLVCSRRLPVSGDESCRGERGGVRRAARWPGAICLLLCATACVRMCASCAKQECADACCLACRAALT